MNKKELKKRTQADKKKLKQFNPILND